MEGSEDECLEEGKKLIHHTSFQFFGLFHSKLKQNMRLDGNLFEVEQAISAIIF